MITAGYKLKVEDVIAFKNLKNSASYAIYVNSILNSPAYVTLMKEHINNVDISKDLESLKAEKLIPQECSSEKLNTIFKTTLSKLVLSICADSIILKELESKNIDDISSDMEADATSIYLLGLAPELYYKSAKEKLENGEVDENDILTKGLIEFNKRQEKIGKLPKIQNKKENKVTVNIKPKNKTIDLSGSNIQI